MTEQENNLDILHSKLYRHFKNYLYSNDNSNKLIDFLQNFIKNKIQTQNLNSIDSQYFNNLLQRLDEFTHSKDINRMMINLCIINLKNEKIINELLNFFDMTSINPNINFETYKQHFINHNNPITINDNDIKKMFEYNKEYFNAYVNTYSNDIETINSKLDTIQKTIDKIYKNN